MEIKPLLLTWDTFSLWHVELDKLMLKTKYVDNMSEILVTDLAISSSKSIFVDDRLAITWQNTWPQTRAHNLE